MLPYFIYIIVLLFLSVLMTDVMQEKVVTALMLLIIFLFSAFRYYIGVDTPTYDFIFEELKSVAGETSYAVEWGYVLLNKAALFFGSHFWIVLAFSFGITLFFTYRFIVFFVPEKWRGISLIVFLSSSFYFVYALSGIRQGIAMSIALYSLRFIVDRRLVLFLLLTALAVSFHTSAILFAPAYFVFRRKIPYSLVVCAAVAAFACKGLINRLFIWFVSGLTGHYAAYSDIYSGDANSNTGLGIIARILIWLGAAYFFQRTIRPEQLKQIILYNVFVTGIVLYVCFLDVDILIRLSEYYLATFIAVVPLTADAFREKSQFIYISVALLLMTVLYFSSILFAKEAFIPYRSYLLL